MGTVQRLVLVGTTSWFSTSATTYWGLLVSTNIFFYYVWSWWCSYQVFYTVWNGKLQLNFLRLKLWRYNFLSTCMWHSQCSPWLSFDNRVLFLGFNSHIFSYRFTLSHKHCRFTQFQFPLHCSEWGWYLWQLSCCTWLSDNMCMWSGFCKQAQCHEGIVEVQTGTLNSWRKSHCIGIWDGHIAGHEFGSCLHEKLMWVWTADIVDCNSLHLTVFWCAECLFLKAIIPYFLKYPSPQNKPFFKQ
jgi:hypothetical protein